MLLVDTDHPLQSQNTPYIVLIRLFWLISPCHSSNNRLQQNTTKSLHCMQSPKPDCIDTCISWLSSAVSHVAAVVNFTRPLVNFSFQFLVSVSSIANPKSTELRNSAAPRIFQTLKRAYDVNVVVPWIKLRLEKIAAFCWRCFTFYWMHIFYDVPIHYNIPSNL